MSHNLAIAIVMITLLHYFINSSIIYKRGYGAFAFSVLLQVIVFLLLDISLGGMKVLWPLIAVNLCMTIAVVITAYTVYFRNDNVTAFYQECTRTVQGWMVPILILTLAALAFHALTGATL